MTGTSLDGLDVALGKIDGHGLDIEAKFVGLVSRPLGRLRQALHSMTAGQPAKPIDFLRAARHLGDLHAQAIAELCEQCLPRGVKLDFVVAHGQTICHTPDEHLSWQLFDPWPIVRQHATAVLYDLRQGDLAAGGQGAPITPLADWVLYRHQSENRYVVNLGGIMNGTELPAGCIAHDIRGRDVGPCNLLIDGVVQKLFPGRPYDVDGRIAAGGQVDSSVCQCLNVMGLGSNRPTTDSLGREDFSDAFIDTFLRKLPATISPGDVVASVVNSVAAQVAKYVGDGRESTTVVLAGGGANNPHLVASIKARANPWHRYVCSDELAIPCAAREPLAFAVLGALTQDGLPITLPQVTGAKEPQKCGAWAYP